MLFHQVFQEIIVNECGTIISWMHAQQQKCQFQWIIKWNPIHNNMNKGFNATQDTKDNPIDQPINIRIRRPKDR